MSMAVADPSPLLVRSLVVALRPRQWTKNLLVFAPLLFAKRALVTELAIESIFAFGSFCLLASGIYVLNDWLDREKDRLHPEKKNRPIAAGLIQLPAALGLIAVCWAGGATLAWAVNPSFAAVAAGYVALQIGYSSFLKRLVILDVMIISLGFIIRVIGGGEAIGVQPSNWLYLCTLLGAVFLGFAKRRHELSSLSGEQLAHRANLNDYSLPMLDQMMSVVAASCILAYGLYTVSPQTVEHVGSDKLKFTVPFVIYGIFRYLFLIHKRNAGGSPERVFLSDVPLIIDALCYLGVAIWALYSSSPPAS